MALSNMWWEPRREITETVAGVVWLGGSFWLSVWLTNHSWTDTPSNPPYGLAIAFWLIAVMAAPLVLIGLAYLIHMAGEGVCALLGAINLDPRPRQRR